MAEQSVTVHLTEDHIDIIGFALNRAIRQQRERMKGFRVGSDGWSGCLDLIHRMEDTYQNACHAPTAAREES